MDAKEALEIAAMSESNEMKPVEAVAPKMEATEQRAPNAEPAESQPAEAVIDALAKLNDDVFALRENVAAMQTRLINLETLTDAAAKQITQFLPPQMRTLGSKIDGLTNSISEPKYRGVLLSLLNIYDLVDQVLRTLPMPRSTGEADHRRNYEVLRTQLRQILEANGLSEISTDGVFNPQIHHALKRRAVEDPAQANRVLEVMRPGFRTEQAVLRYADVVVGQYVPPVTATGEEMTSGEIEK